MVGESLIASLLNVGTNFFGFIVSVSAMIRIFLLLVYSYLFLVQVSSGDKEQRMKEALGTMGASVFRYYFFFDKNANVRIPKYFALVPDICNGQLCFHRDQ